MYKRQGYDPVGIVIEKNMEIIHREDFDKVNIADEDVIEILHFVGGGPVSYTHLAESYRN